MYVCLRIIMYLYVFCCKQIDLLKKWRDRVNIDINDTKGKSSNDIWLL